MSMLRVTLARQARLFSTTRVVSKSATDTVKDAAKTVDKTISSAAIKGIEQGEKARDAIKSATNTSAEEASGKASELSGKAQGTTSETTGSVSGKASELAGEAKGKANELSGKAKGTAEEVKSKM